MSSAFTNTNTGKLHQILFGGALVGLALMVTKKMMSGGISNFQTVAALLVAVALVLLLDKHYWILCPAFSTLGLSIPGLPFDSSEVGCLSLIAMHFIRAATRRDPIAKFNRFSLCAIPVFAWILIIWIQNPTGMLILGSESLGARFYFKIVLGLLTLLTLASMKLGEKECKILFYVLLVSSVFSAVTASIKPNLVAEAGEAFGSTNHYELIRMSSIFLLLYSRYGLSTILTSLPLFTIMLACAGGMIISGKRQFAACVALYPIFHSFITKRDILKVIVVGIIGLVISIFVVAADGVVIDLPHSARRTLAVIFPSYKEKYRLEGSSDRFREVMRSEAKSIIRQHPFVGRKGFAITLSETAWIVDSNRGGTNFSMHVYSGNWHSMWYAYAADFGIPCLLFWLVFIVIALPHAIRITRKMPFSSFAAACCLYYAIQFMQVVFFGYTTGHSAKTCFSLWPLYGFLLAIQNGVLSVPFGNHPSLQTVLVKTRTGTDSTQM